MAFHLVGEYVFRLRVKTRTDVLVLVVLTKELAISFGKTLY